ncbi:MAG: peptidyl-prolyl cis-trans isomerase [Candidatus Eisenbacteria bacterium]|uniref:Peptidyl-prolyl cis-trans isomerase n=1 Tax=Eiseniibacteriota bacterium TaxID=2212470 RepID=A0A9D6QJ71_UNCEI|nr:peptidyl-prolyl cis-trans isomerase [Candidatus Eisenbacteria bacterium]MBI3538910.1 peptidyl-prolyl cis-trans isomerase [Candidatus Eisenbacteria bacterium]
MTQRLATAALALALCVAPAARSLAAGAAKSPVAAGAGKSPAAAGARRGAARRDTVLARVGRDAITAREVQQRIDELPEPYRTNYNTPDGRGQFLDRLVEERVWLLAARRHGVASRPEVKSQIEQTERDLLIRTYVNEVMAANPVPADSEAKAWYEAHAADYRSPASVTLRHILSKTEADARRIKTWAKSGQDWNKLAARYSADSLTRAMGGSLGTVTREGVFGSIGAQPTLAESAMALGSHAIGGPYKSARGWHVIKVDTVRAESVRPFDQVRSVIVRQLGQTRSQDFYRRQLAAEKAAVGFSADSAAIKAFLAKKETAQELFRRAQEATGAGPRIAAYKRVVDEFPNSDVSPQAQFMIGFVYSEEIKDYDEAERAFKDLLQRYPRSELADSAHWMIEHMRTEEAPSFMNLEADSTHRAPGAARATRAATSKPPSGKP